MKKYLYSSAYQSFTCLSEYDQARHHFYALLELLLDLHLPQRPLRALIPAVKSEIAPAGVVSVTVTATVCCKSRLQVVSGKMDPPNVALRLCRTGSLLVSVLRAAYGVQRSESTGEYPNVMEKLSSSIRECLDDGALFALLLGPLIAAGMLHDTLRRLASEPASLRPRPWDIESPMVLPSTPLWRFTRLAEAQAPQLTDTVRALSALATSRRNLVQLFTLCSFVLLVHLARSLRLEVKLSKSSPTATAMGSGAAGSGSATMEREVSDPHRSTVGGGLGVYWLKRGEWRRTRSVVGFAFVVTGGCILVKIATAYIGHGVWSGELSVSSCLNGMPARRTLKKGRHVPFRHRHRHSLLSVQSVRLRPAC